MACTTKSGTSNLNKYLEVCKSYSVWKGTNKYNKKEVLNPYKEGELCLGKVSKTLLHEATNEMILLADLPLAFSGCFGWKHFFSKVKLYQPQSRVITVHFVDAN